MSAFDPAPINTVQRALPVGTRIESVEVGPAIAEDGATVTYRATGPRGEFLVLTEYLPAQIALREADGSVLSASDAAFRAGLSAFVDEARVLMRCDHPSLIGVLDVFEARGTAYCTSRWVDGTRLVDIRRQMTEPPDEEALRDLLEAVLGALNAWQREAGLHGAVTPTNILLLANDRPLLLGPGRAAQAIGNERVASLMTSVEPSFAPPEQIAPTADLPLGPTVDYYALAGVIRYCISGQLPGPALAGEGPRRESMRELARRVRQSWPRLHYGEALLDTLEAALSHRPQDRPQTVAQFRAWLNTGPDHPAVPPPAAAGVAAPAAGPITIDPLSVFGQPPAPPRSPTPRPPAPRRAAAAPVPIDPPGGFTTLGSIPPPEREAPAVSSFFDIDPAEGGDRFDRFDHFERFDRIDNDVRHTSTPPRPAPRPRRRWGALTASAVAVLLVIGAAAGVREYERRREADRTLEIAGGSIATPPAGRPAAPAERREFPLPTEPTAAGPPRTGTVPTSPARTAQVPAQPTPQPAPPPMPTQGAGVAPQQQPAQTPMPATQPPSPLPEGAAPPMPAQQPRQPNQAPIQSTQQQPAPQAPGAIVPQGSPPRVAQSTVPTVQAPAPRAAAPAPTSPREVCGPRTDFSLYRCMTQQCALPQWRFHAQCDRLRRFDRVD